LTQQSRQKINHRSVKADTSIICGRVKVIEMINDQLSRSARTQQSDKALGRPL
jgi:hypothetical protein